MAKLVMGLCLMAMLEPTFAAAEQKPDAAAVSEQMLSSLKVNASKTERSGAFEGSIIALKRGGYIHKRRDLQEDYSAIWKVLKPLDVYGNRVLVVSNEEDGKYIGCCMQDRAEILMSATGDVDRLRDFAKANGCRLEYDEQSDQDSMKERLRGLKIKTDAAKFAQLSCSSDLSSIK